MVVTPQLSLVPKRNNSTTDPTIDRKKTPRSLYFSLLVETDPTRLGNDTRLN